MKVQNMLSKTARSDQIVRGVFAPCAGMIFFVALLCLVSEPALAWGPRTCTKTSWAAFVACQNEARDDYWIARGNCYNLADPEARAECFQDAFSQFRETIEECKDQREARLEVCNDIGEAAYDPVIDPADFVDPTTINALNANQYFPLVEGYERVYEGGDEEITVTVTDETIEILGVTCRVVTDIVEVDGEVIEDTNDWYAQDVHGNVWYFGERSLAKEDCDACEGLVKTDGSWKAGVDYAKPGMIMWANPEEGKVYRQEFALGEAEDMGEVISLAASPAPENALFPCSGNCLQTADYTPIEPDVLEYKFYKRDIGLVLEVDSETGERVELTSFTTP